MPPRFYRKCRRRVNLKDFPQGRRPHGDPAAYPVPDASAGGLPSYPIDKPSLQTYIFLMDTQYLPNPADREERINRIRDLLPDSERVVEELADFFKLFGDSTRIKILLALGASEFCVGDLAELLRMRHSAVSHQLRTLNRSRLVKSRKWGKNVYYSLNDRHIKNVLMQGFEHIRG
jgi:DNA-binding transcriptional ArsR family regulator